MDLLDNKFDQHCAKMHIFVWLCGLLKNINIFREHTKFWYFIVWSNSIKTYPAA